jgi:hypothetical protein
MYFNVFFTQNNLRRLFLKMDLPEGSGEFIFQVTTTNLGYDFLFLSVLVLISYNN